MSNPQPTTKDKLHDNPLAPFYVDNAGTTLTTNTGLALHEDQLSLKAGVRGPTLMEDFVLREKIMHFDHERIPERVVHARGSAAHGYFEAYGGFESVTMAAFLNDKARRTPVFLRFSTVAGGAGSADLARDVRGFAVRFYTTEGNFDLVGNNIPVFFIQDALKFPDLIHAAKPEPHTGFPQAQTAHDNFWDFASLSPETAHMLLWAMSDRAIPRSYRMMQGFGVNTFRFLNKDGKSHFVKFHFNPKLGTHSVVWDEALKVNGADPDFHRRDLHDAIERGEFPEWEFGVQLISEEQAAGFDFDILDPTKLVPEELVPVTPLGRLVLNRNPDDFFAETEQAAFHPGHLVPGIDVSNDPLLQGRLFSYLDTQLSRLGSTNFHQIPINRGVCPVRSNLRDGHMQQCVFKGRTNYEPNSLADNAPCPAPASAPAFHSYREQLPHAHKIRQRADGFFYFFSQAILFWNSQTEWEQNHIVNAFAFELGKVKTEAVRIRTVALLANVSQSLSDRVGMQLGLPPQSPLKTDARSPPSQVSPDKSPALSLTFRPGQGDIRTRKVGVLLADGVDAALATAVRTDLEAEGVVVVFIGPHSGHVTAADGSNIPVDEAQAGAPSVLFDGILLLGGSGGGAKAKAKTTPPQQPLSQIGFTNEFIATAFRHCKPICALGDAADLLQAPLGAPMRERSTSDGVYVGPVTEARDTLARFKDGLRQHRLWARDAFPPAV